MKRILIGLLVVIALVLIPTSVGAQCPDEWEDCCLYEGCCWLECCANQTFDYQVRYFEKVESGFFTPWGTPMYMGVWTSKIVEDVHDEEEAALSLGLRAGYDCWVTKVF